MRHQRRLTFFAVVGLVISCCCWTTVISTNVLAPPHIFEQPSESETAYKLGEDVRLPCVAGSDSSDSKPTYAWKKNDQWFDIQASGGRVVMQPGAGSLVITDPTSDDDGVYQCFVSNALGTAVSIKTTLKLAFVNTFQTITQPVVHSVDVGRSLTLICNPPVSYPKGSVYWGVNRAQTVTNNKVEAIENNDRVVLDYEGNLRFANVRTSDDSQNDSFYSCAVHNGLLRTTVQGDDQLIRPRTPGQGHLRITNVIANDSLGGLSYVCIANNPFLRSFVHGDDQKIRPNDVPDSAPVSSPTVMWTSPRRDVALKGRSKYMKCIFAGFPTPQVTWKRVDGKNNRAKVTAEGRGTEITITNVDFDDAGIYQCTGTNGQGNPQSVNLTLIVQSIPYWRPNYRPTDKQVDEDDSVEFECQADGSPRPNITWYINGLPVDRLPPDSRRTVEVTRLRYSRATTADNCIAQCMASNEHGHILANAALTVTASPPTFTSTPADKKVVKGQNVILTCRVHGAPKPKLTWRKGLAARPVSGSRFVMHSSGDLEILNVDVSDTNTYHCHAENKIDSDTASARLIVREPTRIENPPQSQTANVNDDVTLECGVVTDSAENLTVEWRRNGAPIDFRRYSHLSVDSRTHQLTIRTSKVSDTANYSCHAGNGLDSAESPPATITIRGRPDAPRDVRVTCTALSSSISWIPGTENNDPVIEFIVYAREGSPAASPLTSSSANSSEGFEIRARVASAPSSGSSDHRVTASVNVKPWRSFEFRVTARNGLGESAPSSTLPGGVHRCVTPQTAPFRNPSGVCTQLRATGQLVIVWQPIAEDEYNGKGFYYLAKYKLKGTPGDPKTTTVEDLTRSELVIYNLQTFSQYEISVQSANSIGISTSPAAKVIGFSGEGKPLDVPRNMQLNPDSLNSTFAEFSWDSVDESADRVRGFFRGYRITLWRASDPNNKRTEDIIVRDLPEMCSNVGARRRRQVTSLLTPSSHGRRHRREAGRRSVIGSTNRLWPYSRIKASVAVLNTANSGSESDPIEFETPPGAAGPVANVRITERGSNHLVVEWNRPVEPNGIISKYFITCRVAPPNVGKLDVLTVNDSMTLTKLILELESSTVYRIEVAAETEVGGRGVGVSVDGETRVAASPDKPLIGSIEPGEDSALVTFGPSSQLPAINPGTSFYVEYIDQENADQTPWPRTDPIVGRGGAINVTGLQPGKKYTFRVVGINGIGDTTRETRSEPHTVQVGPDHDGVITYPPPVEPTGVPPHDPKYDESTLKHSSSNWFIILIVIVTILLIILIIVCIVKRNRGEMYPVHEKEKLRGCDPLAPQDAPFGEYTAGYHPDLDRSRGSLDSDEKPLDSDTDSLGEYEDPEATKFNEDGSFIGLYSGQKNRPPAKSPPAVNTFV